MIVIVSLIHSILDILGFVKIEIEIMWISAFFFHSITLLIITTWFSTHTVLALIPSTKKIECFAPLAISVFAFGNTNIALASENSLDSRIVEVYNSAATSYDKLDAGDLAEGLGLNKLRSKVGNGVTGEVLEVGVGTGIQLPYYKWSSINKYTGVDISSGMIHLAEEKSKNIMEAIKSRDQRAPELLFQVGNAKSLPFPSNQVCYFER